MASILYNGKRIIPCPFLSLSKDYHKNVGGSIVVSGSNETPIAPAVDEGGTPGTADDEDAKRSRQDHIIGVTHNITMRGTLCALMKGSPNIDAANMDMDSFYTTDVDDYPTGNAAPVVETLVTTDKEGFRALIQMQASLRALFAVDGHMLEVHDQDGNKVMQCVAWLNSISFDEAEFGENWTSRCNYTIELGTNSILNPHPLSLMSDGEDDSGYVSGGTGFGGFDSLPKDFEGKEIYLTEASENWSIEVQEEGSSARDYPGDSSESGPAPFGLPPQYHGGHDNSYTFRVTHTINATGKRVYGGAIADPLDPYTLHISMPHVSSPAGGNVTSEAWEEAKKWVMTKLGMTLNKKKEFLQGLGISGPNAVMMDNVGVDPDGPRSLESGRNQDETAADTHLLEYQEYNRTRTENIDEYAGTYGVTETWLLSRDPYVEDFNISMRTGNTQGGVVISMDGNIRGLDDNSDRGSTKHGGGDPRDGYQAEEDPIYASWEDGQGIDANTIYNKIVNRKEVNAIERFHSIGFYQRAAMYLQYFLKKDNPRANNKSDNPFTEYSWGDEANALCISPSRLNPLPVSKSCSLNPVQGTISYQVEYDNTPRTSVYSINMDSCGEAPCTNKYNKDTELNPEDATHPTADDTGGLSGSLTTQEAARFPNIETELGDPYDCCPYEEVENLAITSGSGKLYARSENINVQWTGGHQKFAMIPVLGRSYPIAQNLGNRELEKISITIEALMDIPDSAFWSINNMPTNIESEIIPVILRECGALEQRLPIGGTGGEFGNDGPFDQISRVGFDHPGPEEIEKGAPFKNPVMKDYFIESDQETWTPRTGRYNRSIVFVYKQCVDVVTGSDSS